MTARTSRLTDTSVAQDASVSFTVCVQAEIGQILITVFFQTFST